MLCFSKFLKCLSLSPASSPRWSIAFVSPFTAQSSHLYGAQSDSSAFYNRGGIHSAIGNIQTLAHVLSNCSVSLDQGRLTWRHDSVLSTIIHVLRSSLIPDSVFYSDVLGHQAPHGGTIPPHILVTSLRPDIVVIKEDVREIIIFELTCPWDSNIERSHTYKEEKYAPLVADLSQNYRVFCFSFEVSVRGQVTKANKERLKAFVFRCCSDPKRNFKSLLDNSSKASLLSSYSILSARREPSWSSPAPLIIK